MAYKDQYVATRQAKRDPICKAIGAFYIVEYPDGKFDYFPLGAWPVIHARTVKTFTLRNGKWIGLRNKK